MFTNFGQLGQIPGAPVIGAFQFEKHVTVTTPNGACCSTNTNSPCYTGRNNIKNCGKKKK